MGRLLILLMLSSLSSKAQSLLRESPRIVTAYLDINKAKYHTVHNSHHKVAFIIQDLDGGTVVYYFKGNRCTSYSIVRYSKGTTSEKYCQKGYIDAENACITLSTNSGTLFMNVSSY